jgi:hypothetical protein
MQKVRLWSVTKQKSGTPQVDDVQSADNTETEGLLESLLVHRPNLLIDDLVLVGRQVPTEGGPLDLLGVDEDGQLVIFELKRGTLTRDAVAQILDYASDMAAVGIDQLARLIEDSSGKNGIEKIEDFQDWYSQRYPNRDSALEMSPRMVLVGLGVDKRALRIVNYLAGAGIAIVLLTFNAFERDGTLFLARQVESATVPPPGGGRTKDSNIQTLLKNARGLEVEEFLDKVSKFVEARIPGNKLPGKSSYAFSLAERTDQGRPTLRVYVGLYLNWRKKGSLTLTLQERAVRVLGTMVEELLSTFPDCSRKNRYGQIEISLTPEMWDRCQSILERVLAKIVTGWKEKAASQSEAEEIAAEQAEAAEKQ